MLVGSQFSKGLLEIFRRESTADEPSTGLNITFPGISGHDCIIKLNHKAQRQGSISSDLDTFSFHIIFEDGHPILCLFAL